MVDVGGKPPRRRTAVASVRLTTTPEVIRRVRSAQLAKGDALAVARVAGIQAAKRTSEWIPLCHPLPLEKVGVDIDLQPEGAVRIEATVRTTARTGVEMEALTAAAAAALAFYDMAKAIDRAMVIGPLQLESKTGGVRGDFRRLPGTRRKK